MKSTEVLPWSYVWILVLNSSPFTPQHTPFYEVLLTNMAAILDIVGFFLWNACHLQSQEVRFRRTVVAFI